MDEAVQIVNAIKKGQISPIYFLYGEEAYFIDKIFPSAKDMGILGFEKFKNRNFEDVAYFEPFYLKDFVAGKKNIS